MSLHAAYMLIPRNLTHCSRNPKHASKRVRYPLHLWVSNEILKKSDPLSVRGVPPCRNPYDWLGPGWRSPPRVLKHGF